MKTALFVPLLILFGSWGINYSDLAAWYSYPSQSVIVRSTTQTAPRTSTTTTSRRTATTEKQPVKVAIQKPAAEKTKAASIPSPAPAAEPKQPALVAPVPAPSPAPTPTPVPATNSYAAEIEQKVFAGMNAERAKNGLNALTWDARLADMARAHSADMLAKKYFSHNDPNGCGSSCRANNAGYGWMAIGENIYMTEGYNLTSTAEAEMIVQGWMNSPGHRANILGSQFTNSGVGVAVQGDKVYITAMYSKRR